MADIDPEDLQASLLSAMREAQGMQQSGVRVVDRPTEVPPLNLGALMQMAPEQAAQIIQQRRAQQRAAAADDQNRAGLLDMAYRTQAEKRIAEREGKEFADKWSAALRQQNEATQAEKTAAAGLLAVKHFGLEQFSAKNVSMSPTKEKPNPKEGIHEVPTVKFTAQSLHAPGAEGVMDPALLPADAARQLGVKQKVAETLNSELEKRTQMFNEAREARLKMDRDLADLLKDTRSKKLDLNHTGTAVLDFRTGKTFPIKRQSSTNPPAAKAATNTPSVKRFQYNLANPTQLIPVQ